MTSGELSETEKESEAEGRRVSRSEAADRLLLEALEDRRFTACGGRGEWIAPDGTIAPCPHCLLGARYRQCRGVH